MNDFTLLITNWYRLNKRDLPWRKTRDPYIIWLSEIILQQTRVEQGISYFEKFSHNYPTVKDLASASEEDLLNDWQGLGYYSRARNLHSSAKFIHEELNGFFPPNFNEIIKLKGVGAYTAAAISSICYNEKKAVVDGNVYRVLSRAFNISTPIDSTNGRKEFQELADSLISENEPGEHNQALMELGARVCTPKKPKCDECPIQHRCEGFRLHTFKSLPIKKGKIKVSDRYLHFFIFVNNEKTIIQKRTGKGIWENLYQFPLIADDDDEKNKEIIMFEKSSNHISEEIIHILSHQRIHAKFYHLDHFPNQIFKDWIVINISDIQNYPLPRLIDRYLETNSL